jgi:hypothetical protein
MQEKICPHRQTPNVWEVTADAPTFDQLKPSSAITILLLPGYPGEVISSSLEFPLANGTVFALTIRCHTNSFALLGS